MANTKKTTTISFDAEDKEAALRWCVEHSLTYWGEMMAAPQAFHRGDKVLIGPLFPGRGPDFVPGRTAIVQGSAHDLLPEDRGATRDSYSVFVESHGIVCWLNKNELTFIEHGHADLLAKWEAEYEIKPTIRSHAHMDEATARAVLGDWIYEDWRLFGHDPKAGNPELCWPWVEMDHTTAILDGTFTADQLEAIAWWMRNKGSK